MDVRIGVLRHSVMHWKYKEKLYNIEQQAPGKKSTYDAGVDELRAL